MEAEATAHAVEVWTGLGLEGRSTLLNNLGLEAGFMSRANSAMIISSTETMTCTPHPLERAAGCGEECACSRSTWPLQRRHTLGAHLASAAHAGKLIRRFLEDPYLAFPPDIPSYAMAALKVVRRELERREASRVRTEERRQVAERKQKELAAKEAARQARITAKLAVKASYPYRIDRAEIRRDNIVAAILEAKKKVKQLTRKLNNAQRSVDALKRAAAKKGETP